NQAMSSSEASNQADVQHVFWLSPLRIIIGTIIGTTTTVYKNSNNLRGEQSNIPIIPCQPSRSTIKYSNIKTFFYAIPPNNYIFLSRMSPSPMPPRNIYFYLNQTMSPTTTTTILFM